MLFDLVSVLVSSAVWDISKAGAMCAEAAGGCSSSVSLQVGGVQRGRVGAPAAGAAALPLFRPAARRPAAPARPPFRPPHGCHRRPQAFKLLREASGVLAAVRAQLLPALPGCAATDLHDRLLAALEAAALADAQAGGPACL